MWRIARIAVVSAALVMTAEAARADTVLPDNGSVEFYVSSGEATFNIGIVTLPTFEPADEGGNAAGYLAQASITVYDSNGNQIPWPNTGFEFSPQSGVGIFGAPPYNDTCPSFGCLLTPSDVSYSLTDGYYWVDIASNDICFVCISGGAYEVTGDISITPVPAALPLFATGLGALGLFGWRRRKNAAAIATA